MTAVEEPQTKPIERSQLRAAAGRARLLYPGPVGEMVAMELNSWEQVGFRYGNHSLISRLVEFLNTACLPYHVGTGYMCADVYEGRTEKSCAHCCERDTVPARQPLSESVTSRTPHV